MIGRRACLLLPGALGACRWLPRPAVVPMAVVREPLARDRLAPLLVVMLPGAYSLPRDFIDEGFVRSLRARGFAADVWIVDSHLGYAENGTLRERLRDDVIAPARLAGYRRIWLVGISLGGFASLGALQQQPDAIEGVLAIAPYVGQPALLQRLAASGVADFARNPVSDDMAAGLWAWLAGTGPALRAKVHLYTGSQDRFIDGQRLMAALLPKDHVLEVAGDHDWPAWNALWASWLQRAPWPRA